MSTQEVIVQYAVPGGEAWDEDPAPIEFSGNHGPIPNGIVAEVSESLRGSGYATRTITTLIGGYVEPTPEGNQIVRETRVVTSPWAFPVPPIPEE